MLFNNFYFRIKPLIPRPVRLGVRRWLVQRKRDRVRDIWPIMPGSERPPEGWPGWPHGKKFAFVLTHDVESQQGLDRVKKLAELEMELGFRSSFNFIPEGPYSVPPALRSWLVDRGFEVGVHDLHHDGHLFSSRERFRLKAQRINHYVKEWNAVGFRSGYMLRNLDWIHDLNVSYDACTFDTDPFEPQPDGVNTIFPFWVPRKPEANSLNSHPAPCNQPRSGYVELPYTLPQDSTLFLLLSENSIETWKKKLRWIASNGGMALVNVHPDYIDFTGFRTSSRNYSSRLLGDLFDHISSFASVWNALPREIAAWFRYQWAEPPSSSGTTHSLNLPHLGPTAPLEKRWSPQLRSLA